MKKIRENDPKRFTQTQTKTKNDFDISFEDPTSKGDLSTIGKSKSDKLSDPINLGTKLSPEQSRKTPLRVDLSKGSDVFNKFMDQTKNITDIMPDPEHKDTNIGFEPSKPVIRNPDNLPAVINQDLIDLNATANDPAMNIKWEQVKDLPGYAIQQIRGAFRPLFRGLFNTELEKIWVATTLKSDDLGIKNMIGYIGKHGIKDDSFSLEAFNIDPKMYLVEQAHLYSWNGVSYLIIKENLMGMTNYYIYAGPGRGTSLSGSSSSMKQITDGRKVMRFEEIYEDENEDIPFSELPYDKKRNILRTAASFAKTVKAGRKTIDDLEAFMTEKGYNDSTKEAFRKGVSKELGEPIESPSTPVAATTPAPAAQPSSDDQSFDSLSFEEKRNVFDFARKFANAVENGIMEIEDLESFMAKKGYNDSTKEAFRAEVHKILSQETGKSDVSVPDDVQIGYSKPGGSAAERRGTYIPSGTRSGASQHESGKLVLHPEGMLKDGWRLYTRSNISSAPETSSMSINVKNYIKNRVGFIWEGATYVVAGLWSRPGTKNKVMLEKIGDDEHNYLVGEAVTNHSVKAKRVSSNHHFVAHLHGMSLISKVKLEEPEDFIITPEYLDFQRAELRRLDMLDRDLVSRFGDAE